MKSMKYSELTTGSPETAAQQQQQLKTVPAAATAVPMLNRRAENWWMKSKVLRFVRNEIIEEWSEEQLSHD